MSGANHLTINARHPQHLATRHCYGHFAEHLGRCIYDGIWVGTDSVIPNLRGYRRDIVEALKALCIPNLRWPGGCFADTYHWEDGIGPWKSRPSMVNVHWGGVTESNHFGTHEFFELCELLGCEPVVCGNLGRGTVREMTEWLEYLSMAGESPRAERRRRNGRKLPFHLTYFDVGNESWGCGGNMRVEYYADEYRRYATYCRRYDGKPLYRIACGASGDDTHWTEVMMERAAPHMEGLSLHYYSGFGRKNRSATEFDEADYIELLGSARHLEKLVVEHGRIMDRFDPGRKIGLIVDEWGAWHDVEPGTNPGFLYQQNTMRDALVAALSLHILMRHAYRVRMANIAQVVNVLQAMILTEGSRMLLTPSYHVFRMLSLHHDATLLPTKLETEEYLNGDTALPLLDASVTRDNLGHVHLSVCNVDPKRSVELGLTLEGASFGTLTGSTLTGGGLTAHNTFDAPTAVTPSEQLELGGSPESPILILPPHSVTMVRLV